VATFTVILGFLAAVFGLLFGASLTAAHEEKHPWLAKLAAEKGGLFILTVCFLAAAALTGIVKNSPSKSPQTATVSGPASERPETAAPPLPSSNSSGQSKPADRPHDSRTAKSKEKDSDETAKVVTANPPLSAPAVDIPQSEPSVSPSTPPTTPTGTDSPLKSSPPAEVPRHEVVRHERGVVKWFNVSKGYGFITGPSGNDIFVHFSAIRDPGSKILEEGQEVDYILVKGPKGFQAENVTTLHPNDPPKK